MPRGTICDNNALLAERARTATTLYCILDDLHKCEALSCQHGEMPEVSHRRLRAEQASISPMGTLGNGVGDCTHTSSPCGHAAG